MIEDQYKIKYSIMKLAAEKKIKKYYNYMFIL